MEFRGKELDSGKFMTVDANKIRLITSEVRYPNRHVLGVSFTDGEKVLFTELRPVPSGVVVT